MTHALLTKRLTGHCSFLQVQMIASSTTTDSVTGKTIKVRNISIGRGDLDLPPAASQDRLGTTPLVQVLRLGRAWTHAHFSLSLVHHVLRLYSKRLVMVYRWSIDYGKLSSQYISSYLVLFYCHISPVFEKIKKRNSLAVITQTLIQSDILVDTFHWNGETMGSVWQIRIRKFPPFS